MLIDLSDLLQVRPKHAAVAQHSRTGSSCFTHASLCVFVCMHAAAASYAAAAALLLTPCVSAHSLTHSHLPACLSPGECVQAGQCVPAAHQAAAAGGPPLPHAPHRPLPVHTQVCREAAGRRTTEGGKLALCCVCVAVCVCVFGRIEQLVRSARCERAAVTNNVCVPLWGTYHSSGWQLQTWTQPGGSLLLPPLLTKTTIR